MHIVLCPGLGDSPETFGDLPELLRSFGHTVHICTNYTNSFEDRVQLVLRAVESLNVPSKEVALLGVSAGGLAVLIAATRIQVRCVFALVPAPPRGISPLWNPWLLRCLGWYLPAMLRGKHFTPRQKHYRMIALNGLPESVQNKMLDALQSISGREANELATHGLQPKLDYKKLRDCPVHLVGATDDRWVPARMVMRLFQKLKLAGCDVRHTEFPAPHALLNSWFAPLVIHEVLSGLNQFE